MASCFCWESLCWQGLLAGWHEVAFAMGIAPYLAAAIIREHRFRPITGDVLLLGRQTMHFSPEDAANMIRTEGLVPATLAPDDDLLDRRTVSAHGKRYIRD